MLVHLERSVFTGISTFPWRVDTSISFSIIKYLLTSNVRSSRRNIKLRPWRVDSSISFSIIKYLLTSNVRSLRDYQTSILTRWHLHLFLYTMKYLLTLNVRSLWEHQTSALPRLYHLVDSDYLHLFAIWSKGTFGMTVFGTACMWCLEPYEPKQLAVIFKLPIFKNIP